MVRAPLASAEPARLRCRTDPDIARRRKWWLVELGFPLADWLGPPAWMWLAFIGIVFTSRCSARPLQFALAAVLIFIGFLADRPSHGALASS